MAKRPEMVVVFLVFAACRASEPDPVRPATSGLSDSSLVDHPPSLVEPPPDPQADDGPRWAVPSCPLTYQYRARIGDVEQTAEILVDFRSTVAALADQPETLELVHHAIHIQQTLDRKPWGTPQTIEPGEFAAPHLRSEGLALREVDGMTQLWNGFAAVPLVLLWPPLPRSAQPGSSGTWSVTNNADHPEIVRTEAARGTIELPEGWQPPPFEADEPDLAEFRLREWQDLDGHRVATLEIDEHKTKPGKPDEGQPGADLHLVVRYRVLDSGRLLDSSTTLTLKSLSERPVIARLHAEIGLIEACDGPTVELEPFAIPAPDG